jgi:predicted DNA-binding transcriptional regulator AlpA
MKTKANIVPEYLRKEDVATLLQMSGRQVELLVKAGRLPQPIRISSHPRWRRSELIAFIDSLSASDSAETVAE